MEQADATEQSAESAKFDVEQQQSSNFDQGTTQKEQDSVGPENDERDNLENKDATSSSKDEVNGVETEQSSSEPTDQNGQEQVAASFEEDQQEIENMNNEDYEEKQSSKSGASDSNENETSEDEATQLKTEDDKNDQSSSSSKDPDVRQHETPTQSNTEQNLKESDDGSTEETKSQSGDNTDKQENLQVSDTEDNHSNELDEKRSTSSNDKDSRRSSLKSTDSETHSNTGKDSSGENTDSQTSSEKTDQKHTSETSDSETHSAKADESASDQDKGEKSNKNSRGRSRKLVSSDDARPQTTKSQMEADLLRIRRELVRTSKSVRRPLVKPYSPDIFNDLSPYYNKYIVDSILDDLDLSHKSWRKYGQRSTALGIVSPQKSLSMDCSLDSYTYSKVHDQLWKRKVWSKNQSGKGNELGSTLLPPLPTINVAGPNNPKYQSLTMSYDEVPQFRRDMNNIIRDYERRKIKDDFQRVRLDWKRMNLSELQELPTTSRYHVSKAITTYLGTSKGSLKAVTKLQRENHIYADDLEVSLC